VIIARYCARNHPLEPLIKFLSIYGRNSNNIQFNNILEEIYNVPNYQEINLSKCINFLLKENNSYLNLLNRSADFYELFMEIIIYYKNIISNTHITHFYKNYNTNEKTFEDDFCIILSRDYTLPDLVSHLYNNFYQINNQNYLFISKIINYPIIFIKILRFDNSTKLLIY